MSSEFVLVSMTLLGDEKLAEDALELRLLRTFAGIDEVRSFEIVVLGEDALELRFVREEKKLFATLASTSESSFALLLNIVSRGDDGSVSLMTIGAGIGSAGAPFSLTTLVFMPDDMTTGSIFNVIPPKWL